MVSEVDALRVKAEEEKKMEEQHKQDLEAMQVEAQAKEAAHNARMLQHQMTLTSKMRELESRCENMQRVEMQMNNGTKPIGSSFRRRSKMVKDCWTSSTGLRRCMPLCSAITGTNRRKLFESMRARARTRRWRLPFRPRRSS